MKSPTAPVPNGMSKLVRSIRRGVILVILGLLVQISAALLWTPGMFILAAIIGVPAVVIGTLVFGRAAWAAIRLDGEARQDPGQSHS